MSMVLDTINGILALMVKNIVIVRNARKLYGKINDAPKLSIYR